MSVVVRLIDGLEVYCQLRNVITNDAPDDIVIYTEVGMDEAVASCNDLAPGYFFVIVAYVIRNLTCCLCRSAIPATSPQA